MKAAVLHALGETPRCEELPVPIAGPGEVLVRVTAAPINAIDRARAAGTHYSVSAGAGLPMVPGVIGAGCLPDGRRVLFGSRSGTMADVASTPPDMCFPIPDSVDDAVAAAAWNPAVSAWMTLTWRAGLQPGETVLILGATGVTGRLAVQAARHLGAGRVVAAGRNPHSLAAVAELGADATLHVDASDPSLAAAFVHAAGGVGYDVVLDYLWGHPTEVLLSTLVQHDMLPHGRRIRLVQCGDMAGSHIALPAEVLRSSGLEILGSGSASIPPVERVTAALREILDLLARGTLRIEVERVPLERVAEVWGRDQQGRRPVLIP